MEARHFYIDGTWVEPIGTERIEVRNPADLTFVGTAFLGNAEDADRAVAAAKEAFEGWSRSSVAQRLAVLRRMRAAFEEIVPALEAHLVREIGLTKHVAAGQSAMSRAHFDSILDLLPGYAFTAGDGAVQLVREPVGVVAAMTSWNAPVSQILCKAVPAIAAGCTVVVKASEQAPLCAMMLAEAMAQAEIPPGVFNLINGCGRDCGRRLAEHPDVDMVSLTGSVAGGAAMAAAAAPTIKRVHQELGGKSANILLPDADFAQAIGRSVSICMMASGQTCAAPSRLIVPENRFDEAAALAIAAAEKMVVGPPDAEGTVLGPLANHAQFDRVNAMIGRAMDEGVPLLAGGPGRPAALDTGFYVRPTLFGPVPVESFLAQEEVFGPVLVIQTYVDEEDAIRVANSTRFGLAAYVQSADAEHARRVAGRMRAGYVTINFPAWTAAAPFGGYRQSGNGRQYGVWGFDEFLEIKSIVMGAA